MSGWTGRGDYRVEVLCLSISYMARVSGGKEAGYLRPCEELRPGEQVDGNRRLISQDQANAFIGLNWRQTVGNPDLQRMHFY